MCLHGSELYRFETGQIIANNYTAITWPKTNKTQLLFFLGNVLIDVWLLVDTESVKTFFQMYGFFENMQWTGIYTFAKYTFIRPVIRKKNGIVFMKQVKFLHSLSHT